MLITDATAALTAGAGPVFELVNQNIAAYSAVALMPTSPNRNTSSTEEDFHGAILMADFPSAKRQQLFCRI